MLLLFINCMLHIFHISKIYNKLMYIINLCTFVFVLESWLLNFHQYCAALTELWLLLPQKIALLPQMPFLSQEDRVSHQSRISMSSKFPPLHTSHEDPQFPTPLAFNPEHAGNSAFPSLHFCHPVLSWAVGPSLSLRLCGDWFSMGKEKVQVLGVGSRTFHSQTQGNGGMICS